MEVTGIGKLAGTSTGVQTKQRAESAADFSRVLGQVLDSDSSPGDTQQKTQAADAKRDTSSPVGKKEQTDSDDQNEPAQTFGSPTADAQAMAGAEQSAAQAAAAGAAAVQIAVPAESPAAQTVQSGQTTQTVQTAQTQTAALPAEALAASAPALEPEAFAANVKAALEKSADAPSPSQTDTAQTQPTPSVPAAQLKATVEAAVEAAVETTQPAIRETPAPSASEPEKAAALKPDAQAAEASLSPDSAAPQPAAEAQNADVSAQSGGNNAAQTEETVQPPQTAETKKTDAFQTAAQFSTAVNSAQTAQTQDNQEMQAAVSQALERFDQDFQGVAADAKNLQISLHPKELGTVSISLAAGTGGVSAKIQTSSTEAASLLSAQVQRMIESMEAKGVRVQNVEVVLTQTPQQNAGDGGQSGTQQYQTQNTRFYARQSVSVEKGSALSDYERMTETYSTPQEETQRVEYRI